MLIIRIIMQINNLQTFSRIVKRMILNLQIQIIIINIKKIIKMLVLFKKQHFQKNDSKLILKLEKLNF